MENPTLEGVEKELEQVEADVATLKQAASQPVPGTTGNEANQPDPTLAAAPDFAKPAAENTSAPATEQTDTTAEQPAVAENAEQVAQPRPTSDAPDTQTTAAPEEAPAAEAAPQEEAQPAAEPVEEPAPVAAAGPSAAPDTVIHSPTVDDQPAATAPDTVNGPAVDPLADLKAKFGYFARITFGGTATVEEDGGVLDIMVDGVHKGSFILA